MTSDVHSTHGVADDIVEVAVPLRPEHAATLRVLVSSLGSDRGLNVDDLDDLTLAVSEVFNLLIEGSDEVGATTAFMRYDATAAEIRVTFHRGLDDDTIELDTLAATILSSVVDEHAIEPAGITLVKGIPAAA